MRRQLVKIVLAGFFLILTATAGETAERVVALDKNKDGKPDTWYYYRDGVLYKKEYDRNFDGKPDFGVIIEGRRLVEKRYDDNFDGKFEKTVKVPKKGSSGRVRTTAPV